MAKILVIDDERAIRNTLQEILEYEKFKVDVAEDGAQGIEAVSKNKYDVILCDIKMPKMDGIEVLEKIQEITTEPAIVMISGHGTLETAVETLKKGAFDYIAKPLDLNRLLVTVRNALERGELVEETKVLKKKLNSKKTVDIIGESAAINQVKEMIEKVGPTDARVLVTGGNGSGKELVARQLHAHSSRAKSPIVEVNCAAIPSELIESELFGHEKGAFTSAIKQRLGKFEQANGGTLFLDEIGDMSLSAQAKVLRALQENKITRVGGDKDIKVDGKFREDLYHRLSVIVIKNPALNERKEDIPLLADHFINDICSEHGVPVKSISEGAIKELQNINWTGNIREFRNVMERLIILCGSEITDGDVQMFAQPLSQQG